MNERNTALQYIKIAGYNNDRAAYTRHYVENHVSRVAANHAWQVGQMMKRRAERPPTIKGAPRT